MICSLLASIFILALIWPRRQLPGAGEMIVLAITSFICTFGFFLETHSFTLERQLFFNNIGYIGSMTVPAAWFIFALHYTSGHKLLSGWRKLPLYIVPIVIIALVWTNNWHHLMWSNEYLVTSGPFIVTTKTYGPFFWVAIAYSYVLIIIGAIILVRRLFVGSPLYIGQAVSLIVAVSLPFIWSIIYIFNLVPLPHVDLTSGMFAISGIAIAMGLMRFKLFTLVPFARKFLIEQLNDCIMIFDINHRLVEANSLALVTLGMDKIGIGEKMENISLLAPILEQISSDQFSRLELLLTVSGHDRFYETETLPMRDNQNQPVGWLVILRDIDERKRAEDALKASEQRFRQIATELKHQDDQKTEFLHQVAHELKTPLTAIISSSELLTTDGASAISLELKERLINNINQSAWIMDKTVSELLDVAKIQIGHVDLRLEPLDLREMIDDLTSQIFPLFKKVRQSLDVEISSNLPLVKGDRKRTTQVILNLLSNANKFSSMGGHITIIAREQKNAVRIEVKDTAPVIIEAERPKIFKLYYRGGSTEEQQRLPGLGLGLAISKTLVTLMGGEIGVISEEKHGNTFFFTLPIWRDKDQNP